MAKITRGIRNNNPGNIRLSKSRWQGLSANQTDVAFFQFHDPEYGIRAIAKILLTYQKKYGISTIEDVINRWAPPIENDTKVYVRYVAKYVGVSGSKVIDFKNEGLITLGVVCAIIKFENGKQPYTWHQLGSAMELAGIKI